ncbi:MAG: exodeoxyribonuclease VII small subunit [Candidatus Cloacimonetes bacterium]|nr:exodeoxyribonuclease VII small subunit [Candidatus Cloacimonadota bacterium]
MDEMEFEDALKELETIVQKLDDRSIRLKDAIAAMERAQLLSELCQKQLQEAENRVRVLEQKDEVKTE